MSLYSSLLAIGFCILLISLVLFVIFGQVTVRKLRKNPNTKDALGIEFISGWDILNVAMALGLPRRFSQQTKQSPFGMLHADPDVLYEHTTRCDRILARLYLVPATFAVAFLLVLCLMEHFGFFKQ